MKKKFDWKYFADELSDLMGVRCKTLEEAIDFCSIMKTEMGKYNISLIDIGHRLDGELLKYSSINNIITNEPRCCNKDMLAEVYGEDVFIFEWSDYMKDKSETNKPNAQKRKGENNTMKTMMDKMMDGLMPSRVVGDEVALTMTGKIAVKRNNGDYVVYNEETKTIENQMDLVLNGGSINKMCFYIPTQVLEVGDVYKDNDTFYYVSDVKDGNIKSINLSSGRNSTTVKETTIMIGEKFYKKVTSLFSMKQDGNINPMMLMMMGNSEEDYDDEGKFDSMFQMMALSQMIGNNQSSTNGINPFGNINPMLLMMMGGGKSNDMIQTVMMSQMLGQGTMNPFQKMIENSSPSKEDTE